MAKDLSPQEMFKQALAATTKAISADRDVEVSFGNDGPSSTEERIVLRPPPLEVSPGVAALLRGEADSIALRRAHHDAAAHAAHRPQSELARSVYEHAETARIESLGANAMRGTAGNLDAVLAAYVNAADFDLGAAAKTAVLAPAIEFLLRGRVTVRPLPETAHRVPGVVLGEVGEESAPGV